MKFSEIYGDKEFTPEMVREFIELMFKGYNRRKKQGTLYSINDSIPEILIQTYYACNKNPEFSDIYDKFKRKYITNENYIEDVHDARERKGLGCVYDFINNFGEKDWLNIYTLLKIHQLLYSCALHPEFGGQVRNENCFISSSDVSTASYDMISSELAGLYPEFEKLKEKAKSIKNNDSVESIPSYIKDCILLKCKLIKIHPFKDGNGRSCRALLNLLFKQINLPPVYVKRQEKDEYIKAMDSAIRLNDYSLINGFYYYKICDSIIEFDINASKINEDTHKK